MFIENKNNYILCNNNFKQFYKTLYDDSLITDFDEFNIKDFNSLTNQDIYVIETPFKKYFLKSSVMVKDFLTNNIDSVVPKDIFISDKLIIKRRQHLFLSNKATFEDFLFLNKYDYSVAFSEIILKYKLPKNYLLKVLTTGCPDQEFEKAKEYNQTFDKYLISNNTTIENVRKDIIQNFVKKAEKQHLKLNTKYLDLIYLSLIGAYELLSDTTLKLKIKDSDVFENVLKLLIDLGVNKTIYNDVYNSENYSIIIINSKFIYNLFEKEFNNYNFILKLSKNFSNHLFNKIKKQNVIHLKNELSIKYVQEFLYRYDSLYTQILFDGEKYLSKISNYSVIEDHIELEVLDINVIRDKNYIGVT